MHASRLGLLACLVLLQACREAISHDFTATKGGDPGEPNFLVATAPDGLILAAFTGGRFRIDGWGRDHNMAYITLHDHNDPSTEIRVSDLPLGSQIYIDDQGQERMVPGFAQLPNGGRNEAIHPITFDLKLYPELESVEQSYQDHQNYNSEQDAGGKGG